MKKHLTFLTGILVILLSMNLVAEEMISITSGEANRGSGGQNLTVALKNETAIWGILFDIVYDSTALQLIDVASTPTSEQFDLFFWNTVRPGLTRIIMAFASYNWLTPDSGSIADITLNVLKSALPGTYPLTLEDVQVTDSVATLLPVDILNGQFVVTVNLDSLRIYPRTADVACAQTQHFAATGYDTVGPPMFLGAQWSLTAPALGQIDPAGWFTADQQGSGWIKATFQTWADSVPVNVLPGLPVSLDIEPDSAIVVSGAQQQCAVTGLDACDNQMIPEVTWMIHPQNLGVIDQTGLFTAFVAGSGWIVASTNPADSTSVTVVPGPLARIDISPDSASVSCADTLRFSASGYDVNHNRITITPDWVVIPTSLGLIDVHGLFTAAQRGEGWIIAEYETFFDSTSVVVEPGSLATVYIEPDSVVLLSGQSQQFTVAGVDICGNSLTVLAEWSVSPEHLGAIDSEGSFTAQVEGDGWVYAAGSARDSAYVQVLRGQAAHLTLFPSDTTVFSGDTLAYIATASDGFNSWDVTNLTMFNTTDPTGTLSENRYIAGSTGTWETTGSHTFDSTTLTDTARVTVTLSGSCERGNVNCDKNITPGDALCVFWRSILGFFQEECACECSHVAADVNCDGAITPGDALCIFWRTIYGEWPEECDCIPLVKELSDDGTGSHFMVTSVTGNPKELIRVPILIDTPDRFDAFGLELRYPTALLEFQGLSASALTKEWTMLDGANVEPGAVRIGGFHTAPLSTNGLTPIVEVIFTVREVAEGAGTFEVTNLTDDVAGMQVTQGRFTVNIKPTDFALNPNSPNPFNPTTDIRYQIAESGDPIHTTLKIYNILGQEVRTVVDEVQEAGYYSVTWDGKDSLGQEVTSGIYFCRLTAGQFTATRQMVLMK